MNISLNLKQAQEATGLSRTRLYVAMRDGALPARKAGRRVVFLASELEAFINALPKAKAA